jgi:hypothetical protein
MRPSAFPRPSPLPNRVTPFGELIAVPARGALMGNRGGRIHDPETRELTGRTHASKRWITCLTDFKGRRRDVWGAGYTELFFLDEATALAAGHRPCMECRREAALSYRRAAAGLPSDADVRALPSCDALDATLHAERLDGRRKRLHRLHADDLPDSVMITGKEGSAWLIRGEAMSRWTPSGYADARLRPSGFVEALTPPTSVRALAGGYRPAPLVSGASPAD